MGTKEKLPWKISSFRHKRPSLVGPSTRRDRFSKFMLVGIEWRRSVLGSYRASRCRGQGLNPKSWGVEQRKLISCGTMNQWQTTGIQPNQTKRVPRMAATARTIPAKQQKVSPINICEGYWFSFNKASDPPKNTTNNQILYSAFSKTLPPPTKASTPKQSSMLAAATMLCPTSSPLIPAKMLMVFVLYMPKQTMQRRQKGPRQSVSPKTKEKGKMTSKCLTPEQTETRGRIIKKGKRSLQRQRRSSMSSANPSKIVPRIVTKTARCSCSSFSVLRQESTATASIMTMQKETAAAKPMHSGISFSPAQLPFLLMSQPKIFLSIMNSRVLGRSFWVSHQLTSPAARQSATLAGCYANGERTMASAPAEMTSPNVYCFMEDTLLFILSSSYLSKQKGGFNLISPSIFSFSPVLWREDRSHLV